MQIRFRVLHRVTPDALPVAMNEAQRKSEVKEQARKPLDAVQLGIKPKAPLVVPEHELYHALRD